MARHGRDKYDHIPVCGSHRNGPIPDPDFRPVMLDEFPVASGESHGGNTEIRQPEYGLLDLLPDPLLLNGGRGPWLNNQYGRPVVRLSGNCVAQQVPEHQVGLGGAVNTDQVRFGRIHGHVGD